MSEVKDQKRIYSAEERVQLVETFKKCGLNKREFCVNNKIAYTTFTAWVQAYDHGGPQALLAPARTLRAKPKGDKRGRKGITPALRNEIRWAKLENPGFGARKLSGFLARFRGIKTAPNTVQKQLKADNMVLAPPEPRRRSVRQKKIRRFERATPMQLWQSDITSMVLTRNHVRVYLTVFIDDCSRYIVAWNLQLRQTNGLVMDALLRGIDRFGAPQEVLTDQGSQYFSWRGKSEFERLLRKTGIKHVVARSHHPETLGKCERFWETVKKEFWERLKPQDLDDARTRLGHYVNFYNHFRPHQSLGNMVPADRFFGVENEIRAALERTFSENELRLALDERPRLPVFLVGQIGNKSIALHGEEGKLVLDMKDERKEFTFGKFGHRRIEDASERAKTEREEGPQVQGAASGPAGENAVDEGERGAEEAGSRDGYGDDGVLAGQDHEDGSGQATPDSSNPRLAAVAEGDLGYAGRTAGATEREGKNDEPERRSESTEEENRGARGASEDAGCVDPDPQADAGDLPGEEE